MNNAPGQQQFGASVNELSMGQGDSRYALLVKFAELDAELAKRASALGLAVDLFFPDDFVGFETTFASQKQQPGNG